MKDSPEERLKYLVDRFGGGIFQDHLSRDNHRRGEALIRDVFGDQHRREAFVLVMAMKERVVADLLAGGKDVPIEVVCARLVARLEKNLGLTEELARWGVATWAVALGFARPEFQSDDAVAASDLEPATTYISKEMRDDELPHKTAKSPLPPKFLANQNQCRTNNESTKETDYEDVVIFILALCILLAWGSIKAYSFMFPEQIGTVSKQIGTFPKRIGKFGDWTAATYQEGGGTVCYAFTRAQSSAPAVPGRGGPVNLMVLQRASGRDAVALEAGFAYGANAAVVVQVDQTGLDFYTAQRNAFARDGKAAVAAFQKPARPSRFQKASKAIAHSPGPQAAQVTDTFSLAGFSDAYKAISKECPPP